MKSRNYFQRKINFCNLFFNIFNGINNLEKKMTEIKSRVINIESEVKDIKNIMENKEIN